MTPHVLDLIVAVILLLSTLIAYYRGLIREVFTILGLGLAVFGAYMAGPALTPFFENLLEVPADGGASAAEIVTEGANEEEHTNAAVKASMYKKDLIFGILSPALAARLCAYGSGFIAVLIVAGLFSFFISRRVDEMGLGMVDKVLGAGFGFARGFLIVFLFYVPWTFLIDQDKFPAWAKNSKSVPVLNRTLAYVDDKLGFSRKVEDRGGDIAIRIGKVDPDKIGKSAEEIRDGKSSFVRKLLGGDAPVDQAETAPPAPLDARLRRGGDVYFSDPEAELQYELTREEETRGPSPAR